MASTRSKSRLVLFIRHSFIWAT